MLRIAVVTPIFPAPAAPFRGTYNFKLVESLQKLADVEVFCPSAAPPLPGRLRGETLRYTSDKLGPGSPVMRTTYLPYPSIRFLTRPLNGASCGMRLKKRLEESRPDLVFAPWVQPEGYGAMRVCKMLRIPIIVGALGSDLRRVADPLSRHNVRRAITGSDAVITVSHELKRWAVAFGAAPERVFPVLNGCDAEVFHPRDRAQTRRKLGIEPDAELALFVGALLFSKGLRELMEAAEALFERRPKAQLAIVGDGPMRDWLAAAVAASPRRDRFRVLGRRSPWEISEWLGAADFLCLPSHSEGCPNVVVEALSSGRPVVASNVGGIPELVDPRTGILIPPADSGKLAAAMETALCRDWNPIDIYRTAGRSWDNAACETLAVCKEIYDRRKKRIAHPAAVSAMKATPDRKRLKIAVVTAFVPSLAEPNHGIAVMRTLQQLRRLCDLRVIAPVPMPIVGGSGNPMLRLVQPPEMAADIPAVYLPYSTIPVAGRLFNGRRAASVIRDEVAAFQPDVILSYWIYPDGYAAVQIGRELGVPVVLGARGSDLRLPGRLSRGLVKEAVRNCSAVLTVSQELRGHAINAGALPERVHTILNGVNAQRFRLRDQRAVRAGLRIDPEKKVAVFVGRLSAAKGLRELMTASRAIFARRPDFELVVIGSGKLGAEVKAFAAEHQGRVRVLDECGRDEVAGWMSASDLLCLPSYSEGCPNVVIESLASGRPVVASSVGGVPEILNATCGVLIQPKSASAVEAGLEEALGREWDFAAIAEAWNRDWRKVAEETHQICLSVATGAAKIETVAVGC